MSQISDGHDNNNNNSLKNEPPHGDSLHAPPPFIPFEVITEILSRVPVKSLIQFKCVCKSWKTLISDSEFARKHLSTIHHHHNLLLTINDNFDNLLIGSYSLQSVFETAISNQIKKLLRVSGRGMYEKRQVQSLSPNYHMKTNKILQMKF
ncbi:putative F-box domain-containing protein [Lupinus albus]|uniref:Putative F-box domain-containing protein n=1 Tax=Lupinus albus TaxID=3870 RepID=A0A6A4PAX6_LUPAL|nr:putative F-box domain-containing protein [Lupinus albus]